MKLVVDTHTHSIASGHAYSTVQEMAISAKENGIQMFALTDHGPSMPNTCGLFHFSNLRILPEYIKGVRVLKGAEANIIKYDGTIDIPPEKLAILEFVNVAFHDVCITPSTIEDNTNGMIHALKNPYVDCISHSGNPVFPIDIEKVVRAAKEHGKFIEINNHSFTGRKGSGEICKKIIIKCKELGVKIVTGSDAHYCDHVGRFDHVLQLINEVDMPSELVMNTSTENFERYFQERRDRILNLIRGS